MTFPPMINDPDRLQELIAADGRPSGWGIDTEFVRERTYFPRLCLIQVARGDAIWLVDALALQDAAPLAALLSPEHGPWMIHAARQDLEALLPITGTPLAPLFDTQVGASLLGFPAQVGYGELVRQLLGIDLPKGQARTDWAARPLKPEQLSYAADDVRYLGALVDVLGERLDRSGRVSWLQEDCAQLTDPALYRIDPAEAWRRFKGAEQLPPLEQAVLRTLASWREQMAVDRNRPRGWILADDAVRELARCRPGNIGDLQQLASLPPAVIRHSGDALLDCIARGLSSVADCPTPIPLERLTPEQQGHLGRLQQACRDLAAELELAPEVLATRKDLTALVRGAQVSDIFRGWRAGILGECLEAIP